MTNPIWTAPVWRCSVTFVVGVAKVGHRVVLETLGVSKLQILRQGRDGDGQHVAVKLVKQIRQQ